MISDTQLLPDADESIAMEVTDPGGRVLVASPPFQEHTAIGPDKASPAKLAKPSLQPTGDTTISSVASSFTQANSHALLTEMSAQQAHESASMPPPAKKKATVRKKKPAASPTAAGNTITAANHAKGGLETTPVGASAQAVARSSNPSSNVNNNNLSNKLIQSRISSLLAKRDILRSDAAWLSASSVELLPPALAYFNAPGISGMIWNGNAWVGQQLLAGSMPKQDLIHHPFHAIMDPKSDLLSPLTNPTPASLFHEEMTIIENALRANGLDRKENVSLEALGCLLEQARRYALEILADAHDFALHRTHRSSTTETSPIVHPLQRITSADILMAVQFREDSQVLSTLPPRQEMSSLADDLNRIPLPPIPTHCYNGIVLPEPKYQLTARTFDVISTRRVKERMVVGGAIPSAASVQGVLGFLDRSKPNLHTKPSETYMTGTTNPPSKKKASSQKDASVSKVTSTAYGATKGKQIKVNLKNPPIVAPITSGIPASTVLTESISIGQEKGIGVKRKADEL